MPPKMQHRVAGAVREKENEFYLGGMRNPDLAVSKMHMVRQIGADIGTEMHGGGNCEPNKEVGLEVDASLGEDAESKRLRGHSGEGGL